METNPSRSCRDAAGARIVPRIHTPLLIYLLMVAIIWWGCIDNSDGADVPVRRRAADVFLLSNGDRLLGVMLTQSDKASVRIMLRTKWLAQNAPALWKSAQENRLPPPEPEDDGRGRLAQHINELRDADPPDRERIGYLEERLQVLFPDPEAATNPTVVIVQLPKSFVRTQVLKRREARQLAGVAILNDLPTSESVEPATLAEEIAKLDPDSMIRTLPGGGSGAELEARRRVDQILLQTDRLLGKTCRLIVHNGQYISESQATENPRQLAARMLTGQIQSQLQVLLSEDFAAPAGRLRDQSQSVPEVLPQVAVRLATEEQADVVEVTTLDLNAAAGTAIVQLSVYHRGLMGNVWRKIASTTGSAAPNDISPERQSQIADDARVRQVTQLFGGLGINPQQLSQAISVGAVVGVAQQRAKSKLSDTLSAGLQPKSHSQRILESHISRLPDSQ